MQQLIFSWVEDAKSVRWKMQHCFRGFARELEDVCELEDDRDKYVCEINANRLLVFNCKNETKIVFLFNK